MVEEYCDPRERIVKCAPGDALIVWDGARSGLVGKAPEGAVGSTLARLHSDILETDYLRWFLSTKYQELNTRTKGVGIPHLDPRVLGDLIIPVAPLAEQRRIVDAIETRFAHLEAAVKALERARANLQRYRASALWSAFGASSQVSGARRMPLSEIADIQGGITLGKKRDPGEHTRLVPYLRVANVQRGFIDLSEVRSIEATEAEIRRLRLAPGDVLFNEGGDRDKLGRGWVWEGEIGECIHQNHVFRARIRNGMALPRFVSHYGNSVAQQFFWDQGKHTTNMASINRTSLGSLPIPLPNIDVQTVVLLDIDRLLSVADEAAAEIDLGIKRCSRLRDSILSRAFAGRLAPQDPQDEPAIVLVERIKTTNRATSKPIRRARRLLAAE